MAFASSSETPHTGPRQPGSLADSTEGLLQDHAESFDAKEGVFRAFSEAFDSIAQQGKQKKSAN
ncbi:hypothetical protein M441DRAFT_430983 [Trichoderma asperellum CBS 433.97]|uniref:Uncharacterized protein n=1 Tax=Trichoderma asperellum (strain ATCC 204424 / CBS 433.97 / NBRC 101777) TaxID=1042311 RepID=A0A2T3Z6B9_TRIA4|nr:hypothetical protein M441DRAFT_430983 [Trichoderma asperellum CBS 433.97]PTB40344.1 hypothetical protein M441DRAFT_430983 [Trichoderma asperellum CBS 433.97]